MLTKTESNVLGGPRRRRGGAPYGTTPTLARPWPSSAQNCSLTRPASSTSTARWRGAPTSSSHTSQRPRTHRRVGPRMPCSERNELIRCCETKLATHAMHVTNALACCTSHALIGQCSLASVPGHIGLLSGLAERFVRLELRCTLFRRRAPVSHEGRFDISRELASRSAVVCQRILEDI